MTQDQRLDHYNPSPNAADPYTLMYAYAVSAVSNRTTVTETCWKDIGDNGVEMYVPLPLTLPQLFHVKHTLTPFTTCTLG